MAAGSPSIDLHNVTKTYRGGVKALRSVDICVHPGEIYGLLGPNGAGKSTLVKMMMTVIRPTTVQGTMLGHPVGHKATLGRVGYLPEHHRFPPWLTGRQAVNFAGAMCKMPSRERKRRTEELLELVHMRDWAKKKLGTYSKGMQQRVGLAASLVHDPELVLLDEPTDGVDPVGRREIRDVLVQMRDKGKSVLVNSHILSELELVCDRVGILVQGVVSMQGTIQELTQESQRYEIEIKGGPPEWKDIGEMRFQSAPDDRTIVVFPSVDPTAIQSIIDRLRADGHVIEKVQPRRESLEDLFMRAVHDPETGELLDPGAAPKKPRTAPPTVPPPKRSGGDA